MPKEAINLKELMKKIESGAIIMDKPLLEFSDDSEQKTCIFQDSGLNILLGKEGNGKTKFLTFFIRLALGFIKEADTRYANKKILLIDVERPESQYAYTIKHIVENVEMSQEEVFDKLYLMSVVDLNPQEIMESINLHLNKNSSQKFFIIIDHILPMVDDMNNPNEASLIDRCLKNWLSQGHILIVSIHKPTSGYDKGLGHLGSSLQRLASFISEILQSSDGNGFELRQIKSRISAPTKNVLKLKTDQDGYFELSDTPVICSKNGTNNDGILEKQILTTFIQSGFNSRKQLEAIICKEKEYRASSSSASTFYNRFLKRYVLFNNNGYDLTEEGKKIMSDENR